MADDDAYMALALANTQGELHPLEEGLHALGSGLSMREYARAVGKNDTSLQLRAQAAKVLTRVSGEPDLRDCWRCLAEIHAAPSWLWPALAGELVARGWTVDATRGKVAALKDAPEPPAWADADAIASAIVTGAMKAADVVRMAAAASNAKLEDDDLRQQLVADLAFSRPDTVSAVQGLVAHLEDLQAERSRASREARRKAQEEAEMATRTSASP